MTLTNSTAGNATTRIYADKLLQASVVVETAAGTLWLVPRVQGGWHRRQRLHMTDEAQRERLTPTSDIDPSWLGIGELASELGPIFQTRPGDPGGYRARGN